MAAFSRLASALLLLHAGKMWAAQDQDQVDTLMVEPNISHKSDAADGALCFACLLRVTWNSMDSRDRASRTGREMGVESRAE
jgi:hypothetical protein